MRGINTAGKRKICLDGGLATQLEALGEDLSGDLWSAKLLQSDPDKILQAHADFLRAGADVIITASYQCSMPLLMSTLDIEQAHAKRLIKLCVTLANMARAAAKRPDACVAGSIGPFGACEADGSEYTGAYSADIGGAMTDAMLIKWHRPRFELLARSPHVDVLAFETLPCRAEARALLSLLAEFPHAKAYISFSCKSGSELCSGELMADAVKEIEASKARSQVEAVGINCTAPQYVSPLLAVMRAHTSIPLLAYPNSGERWDADARCWRDSADSAKPFDERAKRWFDEGCCAVGGCCRVGPHHIRALRERITCQEAEEEEVPPRGWRWRGIWTLMAAIAAVVVAVAASSAAAPRGAAATPLVPSAARLPITTKPWSEGALSAAALHRTPTVLTNVPIEQLLPPSMLPISCTSLPWSGEAFQQVSSRLFYHEKRNKPWSHLEPAKRTLVNSTCEMLTSGNAFSYAAGELLDSSNFDALRQLRHALVVDEVTSTPSSFNLWMGGNGVVAATHLDYHHNSYLQLSGTKIWRLAHPDEALKLRLFPEAHPRDRQSQVGFTPSVRGGSSAAEMEVEAEEAAIRAALGGDAWPPAIASTEIALHPGQLLYVPPLTFHRVSAPSDGFGISLNVFSDSHENQAERVMIEAGLPKLVTRNMHAFARLLRKVIAYVIDRGAQDDNAVAAAFLSEQLSSRWSPLYTPLGCGEWVAASCPKGSDPLFSDIAAAEIDMHAEKIAAAMREQLGKVDAADAGRVEAVRRLLLVRWVEMTARYVVAAQQEASLCHFMRCLAARWRRMAWSA